MNPDTRVNQQRVCSRMGGVYLTLNALLSDKCLQRSSLRVLRIAKIQNLCTDTHTFFKHLTIISSLLPPFSSSCLLASFFLLFRPPSHMPFFLFYSCLIFFSLPSLSPSFLPSEGTNKVPSFLPPMPFLPSYLPLISLSSVLFFSNYFFVYFPSPLPHSHISLSSLLSSLSVIL